MPDAATIRQLLANFGVRSRKELGQHFLLSDRILTGIVDDARVDETVPVLEIGAGFGALTRVLAPRVREVVAVELDEQLAAIIPQYVAPARNVRVVRQDILAFLDQPSWPVPDGYAVVANLPYQITSRIIGRLLEHPHPPRSITCLVQREVADRMVAPTGERSLLSLAVQLGSTPSITRTVSAKHFLPPPRVDSAVVHLGACATSPLHQLSGDERRRLFRFARMAFAGRRKQLRNSLANGLHEKTADVARQLSALGIDPDLRPQALELDQWLQFAKKVFGDVD